VKAKNVYNLFEVGPEYSLEEQLALLAEITQSFAFSLDINDTLQIALERFMEYLDAEASSIFILEEGGTELVCHKCAGPVDIAGLRLPVTSGIVGETVETKCCQIVRDVNEDEHFASTVDEGTGFKTRSILCAPLLIQDTCIGALELINKRSDNGLFNEKDRYFATVLAASASLAIHNARMANKLVEQERIRKELELAREIQLSLLPETTDAYFPVVGKNVPAREVSGDFYDFFQREDGLIYFNLADVSGKGIYAALLMAKASSLLHHLAKEIDDPGELLAQVNNEICETVSHGMFITIVSGFIDTKSSTISLSNAGHQPPLYHGNNGRFEEIPAAAPPLGIISGTDFPVTTLSTNGGCLYIFTDGVTESLDENNQQLDIDGIINLIKSNLKVTARERLEGIVAELCKPDISQRDDITLMLIDCRSL